jgi:hypothetical protein
VLGCISHYCTIFRSDYREAYRSGILSLPLYHIALSALIFEALVHQGVVFEYMGMYAAKRGHANTHVRGGERGRRRETKPLYCLYITTSSTVCVDPLTYRHFSNRTIRVCVVLSDPSRPSPAGCCASLDRSSTTPRENTCPVGKMLLLSTTEKSTSGYASTLDGDRQRLCSSMNKRRAP